MVWSFIGSSDWFIGGMIAAVVLFRTTLRNDVARDACRYLSWLAATFGVLLAVPAYDTRYLWFAYPAIVAVAATALHSVLAQYSDLRKANLAVLNATVSRLELANGASASDRYSRCSSPDWHGRTSLCCGTSNGSFIFAMRMFDERRTTHVIRSRQSSLVSARTGLAPLFGNSGSTPLLLRLTRVHPVVMTFGKTRQGWTQSVNPSDSFQSRTHERYFGNLSDASRNSPRQGIARPPSTIHGSGNSARV